MINKVIVTIILSVFIIFIILYSTQTWAKAKHSRYASTPTLTEGEKIYKWYCTPCHGIKGDGKGFNAKNLDPRPADHTDVEFMSKRTNKELFDAISGGGKGVGKSTLMPPWGNTFNETQIKSLVLYLRELCKCQGE